MKIKRIKLYNIGPYVDNNIFDFNISKEKNIVLIGGKNGAGKTTFFKAIKTCLYGCKVWGFDAPGKEYYAIINSLVNHKIMYENSANAYIELELVFNDGKKVDKYLLHREWKKNKMSFTEYFHIRKNGEIILGEEEDDFINYLLSIIPPDMFNFYFFDGESIAEFFLGTNGDKNFRNAFLKLYGLDTLSIMVENFNRNIKKKDGKESEYDAFVSIKKECDENINQLANLKRELVDIDEKIDLCRIKIHSLQNDYLKEGGIGLSEWKDLNSEIMKEEANRESLNKWLKEVANNYLPFVIIEERLNKLLLDFFDSQEVLRNKILIETLSDKKFRNEMQNFLSYQNVLNLNVDQLIKFMELNLEKELPETINFDFSQKQMSHIISQIHEKLNFDKMQIKRTLNAIQSSLRKSKKLREKLSSSSIDDYETFIDQKNQFEKTIDFLEKEYEMKSEIKNRQEEKVFLLEKEYEKAKNSYCDILKNKSIIDISERAAAVYSLLEEKLIMRQAKLLQDEFLICFKSIINKNDFIDGIVIDRNINVIPYKNVKVTRSQLNNYLSINKEFIRLFNQTRITIEINRLEIGDVDYIMLPSPIKSPFSQGERQVYIMSIYLALLKTSHKEIPFFIDTPFARIDSNHRFNIVTEFFNKIKNQLFILSTDEEIVGEYKESMDDRISNIFTLEISTYGTTKIKAGSYFGE